MGLLAKTFVEINGNDSPLKKTLAGVHRSLLGLGGIGAKAGASLGAGLAAGLGVATAGIGLAGVGLAIAKAVKGASDLNETVNKVGVIFGGQASIVTAAADDMASRFGVVKSTFMDTTGRLGQLLQGMGRMTQKASAETATELTKLAGDASSLFNTSFEEAAGKIASGLAGETEPLRAFGVDLTEASLASYLLAQGIKKTGAEFTVQQKVMGRTALITRGLAVASGDLAATQGGFANASRAAWGRITNALASAGQAVMPFVENFLGGLNSVLKGVETWVGKNQPMFAAWGQAISDAFVFVKDTVGELVGAIVATWQRLVAEVMDSQKSWDDLGAVWTWLKNAATFVFESIGVVFRNWSLLAEMAGVVVIEKMTNVGEIFTWLMGAASTFATYFANNWVNLIRDAANGAWTILKNLGQNIKDLFFHVYEWIAGRGYNFVPTGLLDNFKAVADKLPEIARPAFTKLTADLDRIAGQIADNEVKRVNDKLAAAGITPAAAAAARPGAAKQAGDTAKAAKAQHFDPVSFSKHLQEGLMGKGKVAERTATAAEAVAKHAKEIRDFMAMPKIEVPRPGFAT